MHDELLASFPGLLRLLIALSNLKKPLLNPKMRLKAWGGLGTNYYYKGTYSHQPQHLKTISKLGGYVLTAQNIKPPYRFLWAYGSS